MKTFLPDLVYICPQIVCWITLNLAGLEHSRKGKANWFQVICLGSKICWFAKENNSHLFHLFQNIIAEHEIRNISCAAQDPEDLSTFAYITKDLKSNHHYCHVFTAFDVVSTVFGRIKYWPKCTCSLLKAQLAVKKLGFLSSVKVCLT